MTTTVIILSYKRQKNLCKIVDSLWRGRVKPAKVIVFNNDPKVKLGDTLRGVAVVNSAENLFCMTKHALGLLAETSHCLFIDDDLRLSPGALGVFEGQGRKFPDAILGLFGVRLRRGHDKPYTAGQHFNNPAILKKPTAVDVVVGRVHYCHINKLSAAFEMRSRIPGFWIKPFLTREGEDVILSLANIINGHKNYILPTNDRLGYADLPDGPHSLRRRGKHSGQRNLAVKALMSLGETE